MDLSPYTVKIPKTQKVQELLTVPILICLFGLIGGLIMNAKIITSPQSQLISLSRAILFVFSPAITPLFSFLLTSAVLQLSLRLISKKAQFMRCAWIISFSMIPRLISQMLIIPLLIASSPYTVSFSGSSDETIVNSFISGFLSFFDQPVLLIAPFLEIFGLLGAWFFISVFVERIFKVSDFIKYLVAFPSVIFMFFM
jgi:hypothetical protein